MELPGEDRGSDLSPRPEMRQRERERSLSRVSERGPQHKPGVHLTLLVVLFLTAYSKYIIE